MRRGRNSYCIQDVAGRSPFRTVLQYRELRPIASASEVFAVCCLKLFTFLAIGSPPDIPSAGAAPT
jgi:hypothetical protein